VKKKLHHPQASKALEELEKEPADEDLRGQMRVQLKAALNADPELGGHLQSWLTDAQRSGYAADGGSVNITATGGSKVAVVRGNNNKTRIG